MQQKKPPLTGASASQ